MSCHAATAGARPGQAETRDFRAARNRACPHLPPPIPMTISRSWTRRSSASGEWWKTCAPAPRPARHATISPAGPSRRD